MNNKVIIQGVTKGVLLSLGAGAVIGAALLFPGIGYVWRELDKERWERLRKRGSLSGTVRRLEKQHLVSWEKGASGTLELILTPEGKKRVLQYTIEELEIPKPKKWDGLWRIIIFDIPEDKRLARNILRKKLKDLECYKLQRSVFIHPYDCVLVIDFLREHLQIREYVHIIIAKEISGLKLEEHIFSRRSSQKDV